VALAFNCLFISFDFGGVSSTQASAPHQADSTQYAMQVGQVFICDHHACERSFPTIGALNYHKRFCVQSKKRLQAALSKGKELWKTKKRARMAADDASSSVPPAPPNLPSSCGGMNVSLPWNTLSGAIPESHVVAVFVILFTGICGGRAAERVRFKHGLALSKQTKQAYRSSATCEVP
jgi:hypothetical protein